MEGITTSKLKWLFIFRSLLNATNCFDEVVGLNMQLEATKVMVYKCIHTFYQNTYV